MARVLNTPDAIFAHYGFLWEHQQPIKSWEVSFVGQEEQLGREI